MANTNRLSQHYLSELTKQPEMLYNEGFEPLLRYIDANSPLHERIGYSVSLKQDPVRLGQTPTMHFHASAFSSVVRQPESGQYKLNNVYWGMFGINGPLPLHFTEFVLERDYRHQDYTLVEFCDIFHHRFLSLFYRSWAVSQPVVSHDQPEHDHFSAWTSSFSGYNFGNSLSNAANKSNALTNKTPTQANVSAQTFLAGLYSNKNRSSGTLRQILSEYLQHSVDINEFEGDWYPLPNEDLCRLGGKNASLGMSTVIGENFYEHGFDFSILVGPLPYADYLFLVNNPHHFDVVKKLTTRHVGSEFNFTIKLLLHKSNIQTSILGDTTLGTNTWLSPTNKTDSMQDDSVIVAYQHAC